MLVVTLVCSVYVMCGKVGGVGEETDDWAVSQGWARLIDHLSPYTH